MNHLHLFIRSYIFRLYSQHYILSESAILDHNRPYSSNGWSTLLCGWPPMSSSRKSMLFTWLPDQKVRVVIKCPRAYNWSNVCDGPPHGNWTKIHRRMLVGLQHHSCANTNFWFTGQIVHLESLSTQPEIIYTDPIILKRLVHSYAPSIL